MSLSVQNGLSGKTFETPGSDTWEDRQIKRIIIIKKKTFVVSII